MNGEYAALAGRIRQALTDLQRVVKRAELLLEKAQSTSDDGYLDGVALNLHGFYAGVERIFGDIARSMEGSLPTGGEWHQDLLLQMAAEVSAVRPAVIAPETRDCLDEYRGFRHVIRNVYTFNLRPGRLRALTAGVSACYRLVARDLQHFADFLERTSAAL